MNEKITKAYLLIVCGLILFLGGVYVIKQINDLVGILEVLTYASVGLGSVMFGHGVGEIVLQIAVKRAPIEGRQLEIDNNDERNIAIANRTKAKTYDMMVVVFAALLIAVALIGVDITILMLFVFTYAIILVYGTYYRYKFNKEV